jgi:hypothetical protein
MIRGGKPMRLVLAVLLSLAVLLAAGFSEAQAQATCRQKCMDEENACLKRTNNKGQCGDKAKTCSSKCK